MLKFDPNSMLDKFSLSPEDKAIFIKEIFLSSLWRDCDRGCGYRDTTLLPAKEKLPKRLHKTFYSLCCRYDMELVFMPETEGIKELISELKKNGYKLYLLSNVGLSFHVFNKKIDVLSYFDGMFPSCDYGLLKPEKEIYEAFFRRFLLLPDECLFIDDTPENIEGSINAGMPAISFNASEENTDILRKRLISMGVDISV